MEKPNKKRVKQATTPLNSLKVPKLSSLASPQSSANNEDETLHENEIQSEISNNENKQEKEEQVVQTPTKPKRGRKTK